MDKGFDDFRAGEADVPRGVDVDVQLFLAAALRGEGGQRYQLALAQVERRAVVNLAEGEADDVLPQLGGDVCQRAHHRLALFAVDGVQGGVAALQQFRVKHGLLLVVNGAVRICFGVPSKARVFSVYHIQEFATLTGLSADTLRFYEKEGLLAPARDGNGYRIYSARDAAWLAFILRLKETNMPLAQIKEFARLRAGGEATLAARYELLLAHQQALTAELARLADHQAHLAAKLQHYQALLAQEHP